MQIRIAETAEQLSRACDVLLQLRPQYNKSSILAQVERQRAHGYQIAMLESNGEVPCVAGFVIGTKLAWGRHLYIDDLITASNVRSTGAGQQMLDWLKNYAIEQGCQQLHLDSGVQRFDAHRFYLRERMYISAHHFSFDLTDQSTDTR